MARKSKIINAYKHTMKAVVRILHDSCNTYQLMLNLGFEDVSIANWSRWRSGANVMSEERAAKILSYAIKHDLLDNNNDVDPEVESNAIILLRLLDPRIRDVLDELKQHRLKEIEAAEVIKNAWRRQTAGGVSKSTLVADLQKIVDRNKSWLAKLEEGDQSVLLDALDLLYWQDSKSELTEIYNEIQAEQDVSLTRHDLLKKRAAIVESLQTKKTE